MDKNNITSLAIVLVLGIGLGGWWIYNAMQDPTTAKS